MENKIEIYKALVKFQADAKPALKTTDGVYKNKYATIEDTISANKKLLADNGLGILQPVQIIENKTVIETILFHISGQEIRSIMPLQIGKQTSQGVGSAITYARRYAYQSILGLITDDDDAQKATEEQTKEISKPELAKITGTPEQIERLKKAGMTFDQVSYILKLTAGIEENINIILELKSKGLSIKEFSTNILPHTGWEKNKILSFYAAEDKFKKEGM